jgi:cellulose synthase/poly-beta-1,6-N-acetylglucosamine synthase-like glycosyltransferase
LLEIIGIDITIYCLLCSRNSFALSSILFDISALEYINSSVKPALKLIISNNYQNGALSIYATVALFFVISMFATLSSRPMVTHASFKKIIASLLGY